MSVILAISALGLFVVLLERLMRSKRSKRMLPPGPSRFPIVGNALQIPKIHTWLKYTEWAKTYGKPPQHVIL